MREETERNLILEEAKKKATRKVVNKSLKGTKLVVTTPPKIVGGVVVFVGKTAY